MSLENYLVRSNVTEIEIRSTFSAEAPTRLYNLLKEKGYIWYLEFLAANLQDILKYLSLPPSRRLAKKWTNRPDELVFRFAALQISVITLQFESDIVDIAAVLDHGSYREFHSIFADALAPLLLFRPWKTFPFDGYDSPFS
ncbi:MAG: hypothetical protein K2G27_00220 [Duncaniella sp.]|nr:hypothetical protein [Duncaniella sp.]